jgi:hypothetical protein
MSDRDRIIAALSPTNRLDLRSLCDELGIAYPSSRRWSRTLHARSAEVSRELARLRAAGRVRHVRAAQASGWELRP